MRFLSYDSPLSAILEKVIDIFWLSILWIVCSLPIVTAGAATASLYYTSVKTLRRNRDYVAKSFFHAMKMNLGSGVGLTLFYLMMGLLFYFSVRFVGSMDGGVRFFLACVYLFWGFLTLGSACYAFPVLSRCRMRIREILWFSLGLAIRHFPWTLLLELILAGSVWLMASFPYLCLCIPAVGSLCYSMVMERILLRYTPECQEGVWYAETENI